MVLKLTPYGRDGLFTSSEQTEYWKAVRKGTALAFSTEGLKTMYPRILQKATELVGVVRKAPSGQPIDFQALLPRFTLDTIGLAGFGIDFKTLGSVHTPLLDALKYCSEDVIASKLNPFRKLVKTLLPNGKFATECNRMYKQLYAEYNWLWEELKGRDEPAEDDTSIWACLSRVKDPKNRVFA